MDHRLNDDGCCLTPIFIAFCVIYLGAYGIVKVIEALGG